MRNISELLSSRAARTPTAPGITYKETTLTWHDCYERAYRISQQLQSLGIERGDTVAIYTDHVPAQAIALFGVAMADGVFTILHRLLKKDQLKHQVSDANVKAVIGLPSFLKTLEPYATERKVPLLPVTPWGEVVDAPQRGPETPTPHAVTTRAIPSDVGVIIYTSGSTGKAKGVVTPHRTLLDGARIVSGYLGITDADTILSVLPFNFDYGLNQLLTAVYAGARIVLHPFTLASDFVRIIEQEGITGVAGVPSMWPVLFDERFIKSSAQSDFSRLRYLTTAGGGHPQALLKKLKAFFPHTEIIIMYGLTESFRSAYLPFKEIFQRPGSIGKAVPEVELLVMNERGERCKPGEKGELIHRGAFISYGYLNNPELSKERFIALATGGPGCLPEMAVRSGDIVSLDDDGFIYYHGRADMQIKSSGYRVSPGEVEEVVLTLPGIRHAAAFGVPDEVVGQAVAIAYTTYSGQALEWSLIQRHCSTYLPAYAVPRHTFFYEQLPLTVTGKIDYAGLKREAEARVSVRGTH